ncbi:hypothetical protein DEJ49_22785 [Streptomyces venezuelae]|uniref:Uncharacterized protein n=1 Tax=Streptomyces venezuelae TaxID=54571 RepID=A0A5P2CNY8_STRVZ|nr:hypothetical protein DEJ49_22785 [Streptomyces venezuelae]
MGGHRPSDWHVLDLEKDPTPGDPHRVRSLAKNLHDFADDVGRVLRDIKGMAGDEAILKWVGKTADAFTEKFEDAPSKLKKLKKSYEMAGDALSAYWPELERAQSLADKALVKGREAQADLSSAKSRLSSADSWVERAGKEADKYKDKPGGGKDVPKPDEDKVKAATRNAHSAEKAQKSAQGDVDSAKSALEAAKKMAADARKMREEAAGTAKKKIDEASDAGIRNRKWWEEIGDWVSDNWDTIVAVCKVVVAVVGIIAMIVGGPILAAIVIVAGAIVLADTLSKYAKGQAGLMDVAFAAMDCVPGMKGITTAAKLAKGMKGLKGGLKGMKSARTALKDGAKGAYNRTKSKIKGCGDPVDVATGHMFLQATDVTLPGTLPLSFTRRMTSGYRTGGWFGPSWTSTVDQRLELDEDGVVFVTEDGMLLTYPHPAGPDAPVLPDAGPRRPLERLDNGGYLISDPVGGRTLRFTAPDDDTASLTRMSDRNGNTVDIEYDDDGRPLAFRHSHGYRLTFAVTGDRVTALALAGAGPDGADVVLKRYDYTDGNLTAVADSSGLPTRFTYDDGLRITSWTDSNGNRYDYMYDDRDRCVAQGGEAGHLANTFTYDVPDPDRPGHRVTEVTTSAGATSRFVINDRCLIVAETNPLGHTVLHTFDERDEVISRTDGLGRTTRYEWDALGNLVAVHHPDRTSSRIVYNEHSRPVEVHESDGRVWHYTYDERGNHLSTLSPAAALTRFAYDDRGRLTSVTDPLGHTARIECDAAGLPLRTVDPLGGATRYERDGFGRPTAVTAPSGAVTRLEWTVEGRIARHVAADGGTESWTYDGEGNCTTHTDAVGGVSTFEYTHFDLLSARTGPDGARYTFEHDAELQLRKVVNPLGLTWSYEYDSAGRLVAEDDFDGRALHYVHDAADRLTARTLPSGETIRFERDVLGRTVAKDAAGDVTTYTYDDAGDLIGAHGPDVVLTLERDAAGHITSETVAGRTSTYTYDALGRRTGRTTPSGAVSTWTYDAAGNRAELVTSGRRLSFTHDADGRELSRRLGEDVAFTQGFDVLGRLTSQEIDGAAGRVQSRAYTYRADGHLVGVDDLLNGARRFDLDPAGRVTAVHAAGWSESYAYDAAGNQTSASWPSPMPGREAVGARTYTGTRIRTAGGVRYEYDRAGRIVLRQKTRLSRKPDTWRYAWDVQDRLTSVVTPDGTRWRYQYDPLGRRTAKQRLAADGESVVEQVDFTWDETNLCEQTSHASGGLDTVTLTWEHNGLHPLTQAESKRTSDAATATQHEVDCRFYAIVTDLVGAPTELLDEHGGIVWRTRSSLWGATAWNRGATAYTPLRFPGQYHDVETGLHYNYFRHYDPETARYLTPDPLGLTPDPNHATYVHNPHTWSDPLGLTPCEDEILPKGYTSSPALEKDPYHPDMVGKRSEKSRELYAATPKDRAAELGYKTRIPPQRAPFHSHGQEVFSNGKNYITPDVDGHNVSDGWKVFNKKGQRIGTYDADLNYIKK